MRNPFTIGAITLVSSFILASLPGARSAAAQQFHLDDQIRPLTQAPVGLAKSSRVDENTSPDGVRHYTLDLINSPAGQDALRLFRDLKTAGQIPYAQKGIQSPVGSIRTFTVADTRSATPSYIEIQFEKKAEGPSVNIWVSTSEIANGHVLDSEVETIRRLASESTGFGSIDPSRGIVENNETVFGPPPNVDGDNVLDILLLDILDDYETSGVAILGFFDPANLVSQNQADIVYLDTFPGLVDANGTRGIFDNPSQTLAHEYEHLIWSKVGDGSTFINEGLAEWGEVINGFTARPTNYYQVASEREQSLFGWRGSTHPLVLNDYQRAGLFSNYLADRLGVNTTGTIARSLSPGLDKYINVLIQNGFLLSDVVLDFHTANLINDRSVDPVFGYTVPQYAAVSVASIPGIDGSTATSTFPSAGILQPGAVFYYSWKNVANLEVDIAGNDAKIQGRFVLETLSGEIQTRDAEVGAGSEGNFFGTDYSNVSLILTNVDFAEQISGSYDVSSTWRETQSSVLTEEIAYDTGELGFITIDNQQLGAFQLGADILTANRFEVPASGKLTSVKVDHIYLSDFGNTGVPPSSPRNFTLHIWAENQQGEPGEELLSIEVNDNTAPGFFTAFDFQTISLEPYANELANLPSVIFVGVGNAGSDPNEVVMTISNFPTGTTPSYMFNLAAFGGSGWSQFNQLSLGTASFALTVLPIRAVFTIDADPVALARPAEIPADITLHQNYPNPFNPSTTIEYTLPDPGNVRVVVYDMLGRRVATVVNEFRGAGVHQVNFDASDLSSGLYLYSLETGTTKVTRTMTILR